MASSSWGPHMNQIGDRCTPFGVQAHSPSHPADGRHPHRVIWIETVRSPDSEDAAGVVALLHVTMKWSLALVALAVLAVAAVSRRLSGTPVTAAMVFVAIGVLVGPEVAGEVDPSPSGQAVRTLAEATLAVVL